MIARRVDNEQIDGFDIDYGLCGGGLVCNAGAVTEYSFRPHWDDLIGTNVGGCVNRDLPSVRVVDVGDGEVVMDWSNIVAQYASITPNRGVRKWLPVENKSEGQRHLKFSKKEYYKFEDDCEGLCPSVGDVLASWQGGKMYGLMEVGYDNVVKVDSIQSDSLGFALKHSACSIGSDSLEFVLKHSVYMTTNDMMGCVLKLVSCTGAESDVYLGTWAFKLDQDANVRFSIRCNSWGGLYSDVFVDLNGNVCIYVGRDGVQSTVRLKKENILEYQRIVKSSNCLRAWESSSVVPVESLPCRIMGAEISRSIDSLEKFRLDDLCTAKGNWKVWKEVSPKVLSGKSLFDTVECMYRQEERSLRAVRFQKVIAANAGWVECRDVAYDVANRIFNDIGVFVDFGASIRPPSTDRCFAINAFGKRRDGICVSFALSKANAAAPVEMGLLVEFEDITE